ncbi:hypothetical protein LTR82_016676 [Friedmanniomyces endolithicus]|uniref:Protein kinase domain-containing protein n=1 Tax=Friedmanniomyces endolithicus TaxID=329885 RepID=A0AAN6J573_9PEZI|nr:hypothetical protein LTR82_016676 [Friedmanniomyces endolithicus]
MSKFFRSPTSPSTSSSDDNDSVDDGHGTSDNGDTRAEPDDSTTDVTTTLSNLNNGSTDNGHHSQMLLHALLEERCTNEALKEHQTKIGGRVQRDDAMVRSTANAKYQHLCTLLARHGLIAPGLEADKLFSARQSYRDGLNLLSQGCTSSFTQQANITGDLGRLLTRNQSLPAMGTGYGLRSVPGGEMRLSPLHSNYTTSTKAGGERAIDQDLQLFRLHSETPSVIDTLVPNHPMLEPSRYLRDFDEIAVLGKGGYGVVYHVRNRLDGLQYAVKKVPISPARMARIQKRGQVELDELLLELRTLARLDHPNIVRYFAGWIEWTDVSSLHPTGLESGLSTGSRGLPCSALSQDAVQGANDDRSLQRIATESETELADIVFERSNSAEKTSAAASCSTSYPRKPSWSASISDFHTAGNIARPAHNVAAAPLRRTASIQASKPTYEHVSPKSYDTSRFTRSIPDTVLALHLQMGLYPMTLADVFSTNGCSDATLTPLTHCFHLQPSISILLALVDGVEYLHNHGIVHRDLKPANIFIAADASKQGLCSECHVAGHAQPGTLEVRIGDFGLVATLAQSRPTSEASPASNAEATADSCEPTTAVMSPSRHLALESTVANAAEHVATSKEAVEASGANGSGTAVGTELYRPKRVPKHKQHLDMYALAIIAFELLYKFNTRMERHHAIHALKDHSKFPNDFMRPSVPQNAEAQRSHLVADIPVDSSAPLGVTPAPLPQPSGFEVDTAAPRPDRHTQTDSAERMKACIGSMLAHDPEVTLKSIREDLLAAVRKS